MKRYRGVIAGIFTLRWIMCGWASYGQNSAPPRELSIDLGDGVKMEFVLIPPGTFMMGEEKGADNETPAHRVTITRPFYLAKYEVTREQYQEVIQGVPGKVDRPRHPVDFARWNTCQEFLAKLNQKKPEGGFRLPTEAEWEYAARAGAASRYSFGNNEALLPEHAWFGELAGGAAHPVGQKRPNPSGLYDMYGNVWEWCQDFYGKYDAKDQVDPTGPTAGQQHVFRGGAWNCRADRCRSAARDSFPAAAFVLGFRVAMPVATQR